MDAPDPQGAYKHCYRAGFIENGPRLVSKADKTYRSLQAIFEVAEPYMAALDGGEAGKVVDVPGPWHAVAVAISLQQRLLDRDQHVIFRGQANSLWPLIASIYRPDTDPAAHDRAWRLTAWFLASNSYQFYGTLEPEQFFSAAQHYGIKTNLMDFTPDPAVAVWFASQPRINEPPNCPTASVYVMRLEAAWQKGARIFLPPPFVERLYRQRGVFLQSKSRDPLPPGQLIEIRFPANLGGRRFKFDVVREGRRVPILADHTWLRKVINWAWHMSKDANWSYPKKSPKRRKPS